MILSTSGWRAIFAPDEQSQSGSLDEVHRDIVAVAAHCFFSLLTQKTGGAGSPVIVIGSDTRPTGPAILDTVLRVFVSRGVAVRDLGIVASPEIMAYVKTSDEIDAFFYVSASHNPIGHNGFKMGLADGAVLPRSAAIPLIEMFRRTVVDDVEVEKIIDEIRSLDPVRIDSVIAARDRWKRESEKQYDAFLSDHEVESGENDLPVGIVADFNGSARTTSIDRILLPRLGFRFAGYNDRPGEIVHQILPEGVGLDDAAELLRKHHRFDPVFEVAYTPDNDGDRGNLVFIDDRGEARILDAQTVFALVVMIELADDYRRRSSLENRLSPVVVANGPSSGRITDIARIFASSVIRAEVGEANVVSLIEKSRTAGMVVPIAGEGSNGGTIKPPATVRDPLATILSLRKLRVYRLDRLWDHLRGREERSDPPRFAALADELPRWTTLATDDADAKMHVGSVPHGVLKSAWEHIFLAEAERYLELLNPHYGNLHLRVENYEGTETRIGPGNRTGDETGGLKVLFLDNNERDHASVWMRGSGTEPVFRVLAECRGDNPQLLKELILIHREQVKRAAG